MLNFKVVREDFYGNKEVVVASDRNEVLAWTGEVRNGEEVREYIRIECAGDARRAAAVTGGYKVLDVKLIEDKEYWDLLWRGHKDILPVNFIDLGEETQVQRRKVVESDDEEEVMDLATIFACFNC